MTSQHKQCFFKQHLHQALILDHTAKFEDKSFSEGRVHLGVIGPQSKKFCYPVISDTEDYPWEKFERTCSVNIATMCLQVTENVRIRRCGGYRPPRQQNFNFPAFTSYYDVSQPILALTDSQNFLGVRGRTPHPPNISCPNPSLPSGESTVKISARKHKNEVG
jgi:hypothetical protein